MTHGRYGHGKSHETDAYYCIGIAAMHGRDERGTDLIKFRRFLRAVGSAISRIAVKISFGIAASPHHGYSKFASACIQKMPVTERGWSI